MSCPSPNLNTFGAVLVALIDEQRKVVEAPLDARMLVTAGPGTGKTHTLIARLQHLIDVAHLSPGSEVLVLSFSRAAVREIRRRLVEEAAGKAAYVRALTFDSFATRFLAEALPDGTWPNAGYDDRIRMATAVVRSCWGEASDENDFALKGLDCEEVRGLLGGYRHILVDEVQDLVAERADLTKALLPIAEGFSLFGDPAQGIYTFLLEGNEKVEGSRVLYDWVRQRFAGTLVEHSLITEHRFETPSARRALWAGSELNAPCPDYTDVLQRLKDTLKRLTCIGDVKAFAGRVEDMPGRTAVLTRTNGEALLVSRKLHELGVEHVYQRASTDRVVPAWIASVLRGVEHNRIGRRNFLEHAAGALEGAALSPDDAWQRLKWLDGPPKDSLDLARVSGSVRDGRVPDELIEHPNVRLVVSTVHRAKGLEFDCVFMLESNHLLEDGEGLDAEEARVLYVALTRPRRRLLRLEPLNTFGMYRSPIDDRWLRRYPKGGTTNFEIRADDIRREEPPGAFLLPGTDPLDLQGYLETKVKPGDSVALSLLDGSDDGDPRAYYALQHCDRVIGITSERFGQILHQGLKVHRNWRVSWPTRIESLFLEGVETVAGDVGAGRYCGVGAADVWLRPRVSGLGRLKFR